MAVLRGQLCGLLVVAALTLMAGCGKKGALIAPEALAPAPVSDLAVAQKGERFQLSWSAPSRQESDAPLKDLAGFLLLRRLLLPPAEDCEECPSAYAELARVDLDYLQGVRRMGNRFLYDDAAIKKGKSYQYKLRSFTADGTRSRDSNKARASALTPPLPPVLDALSSASGVVLAFVSLPPAQGNFIGYNIYRSKEGDEMPLSPLNATAVTGTTYEDKDLVLGVRYSYKVTTLAELDGQLVESAPSKPAQGAILERD